jgi:glucose/arabinose dehydrogenase
MWRALLRLVVSGGTIVILSWLFPSVGVLAMHVQPLSTPTPTAVSLFATGLDNPRGLRFGPDGKLYVAEGGRGGTHSTAGKCTQVPAPVGPYTGNATTGRISAINTSGVRTTVVDNLPSSQTSPKIGSEISGVSDVAFVGNTLYGLLAGAGCSHGVPTVPNSIVKINQGQHSWTQVADLSHFLQKHPVKNPNTGDFEPDGTWYSMVAVEKNLYAVEPNHGELDKIEPKGTISRVADISASQGHNVPTVVAYHNGNFYVGNLGTFPITQGQAKILKITPRGQISTFATGLTTVLGTAFDAQGRLYVLENTVGKPMPTPGAGRVVRLTSAGKLETIASGLSLPTAMTFGPDKKLYVSTSGFDTGPGKGQIMRITV